MSRSHDIYNPPPVPVRYEPPATEPIVWTGRDLVALAMLACPVYGAAVWAWSVEPTLGLWVTAAGLFMILESWLSAVTFLHRHPEARRLSAKRRWLVFLVALLPWLICLVAGVALMLGLFVLSDRLMGA
ncbi:MAG: hypothetical protein KatS3mg108_2742 [Isosphaeraceae bacterium]|jgi:hypothetical protein|nr:MAG: hypothetical protein KatS3mg108_2742 [Isosphaeraceae bacterium]